MRTTFAAIASLLLLAASFGLALAGEPSSHWFWRALLRACR